jgi:hypothetical protein
MVVARVTMGPMTLRHVIVVLVAVPGMPLVAVVVAFRGRVLLISALLVH